MTFIRKSAKAWVAALVAGLSFLVPVVDDGLLVSEALGALLAGLIGFQATFWVRNARQS